MEIVWGEHDYAYMIYMHVNTIMDGLLMFALLMFALTLKTALCLFLLKAACWPFSIVAIC